MNKNKIKKIAGYCRLSRDEDKENFISIEEQKRIIKDYAKSRNWNLTDDDFYIDDNVSGYTFNRPAFSKMMKKVKIGEIHFPFLFLTNHLFYIPHQFRCILHIIKT